MISLDEYRAGNDEFVGGANLYYSEVRELLLKQGGVTSHSFSSIVESLGVAEETLRVFGEDDVVLSNAGFYGYVYHYLRERLGLKFRIVRDVQAAFHAGYFFQEELCAPLTREGDLVLFPSQYARQLYIRMFPDFLTRENTDACYPLPPMYGISAAANPAETETETENNSLHIGYLGRISAEKNVDQLFSCLSALRTEGRDVTLSLIGQREGANSPWYPGALSGRKWVTQSKGRLSHDDALKQLASFDLLAFPSTSSVETLGRVLLEAASLNVPVVAAAHAAVPEFIPQSATVEVEYSPGFYPLTSVGALGRIDETSFKEMIRTWTSGSARPLPDTTRFESDQKRLPSLIKGKKTSRFEKLKPAIRSFLERIDVHKRTLPVSAKKAVQLTAHAAQEQDYRHIGLMMKEVCSKARYRPVLRITP